MSDGRSLRFTRSAEKELRRLDPPIRSRVLSALDRLAADDRSLDVSDSPAASTSGCVSESKPETPQQSTGPHR